MNRRKKLALWLLGLPLTVLVTLAVVGTLRESHVVTVTRSTCADRDVIWELWADVSNRTEWDQGLDYIEVDGAFEAGTTGTVKVDGQDPISYEILAVDPKNSYTDRFESLLWTHTDWHHEITRNSQGCYDVTWRLEARGPLSLISLPVLKNIFGEEIPTAVDEFVELAESRS